MEIKALKGSDPPPPSKKKVQFPPFSASELVIRSFKADCKCLVACLFLKFRIQFLIDFFTVLRKNT